MCNSLSNSLRMSHYYTFINGCPQTLPEAGKTEEEVGIGRGRETEEAGPKLRRCFALPVLLMKTLQRSFITQPPFRFFEVRQRPPRVDWPHRRRPAEGNWNLTGFQTSQPDSSLQIQSRPCRLSSLFNWILPSPPLGLLRRGHRERKTSRRCCCCQATRPTVSRL